MPLSVRETEAPRREFDTCRFAGIWSGYTEVSSILSLQVGVTDAFIAAQQSRFAAFIYFGI